MNGTTELPLNLTINTTNKTGYTATLNTETNETALVNSGSTNGAKIDSITGASSILNLPVNTWGFKTSSETNYNPIPSLVTPTNIFQTTEKTNGNDVRGLNIGMKLGQNIESGSYDNKLIFSVVTNPYVGKAVMTEGPDFNEKLKKLGARYIPKGFKKSSIALVASMEAINIEDEDSDYDIKMWIVPTERMVYYYTESEKIYLNKNSSKMFYRLDDRADSIRYIANIDLFSFDTSNVTDMSSMFAGMNQIEVLNLSSFDTSKVTNMSSMFEDMYGFTSLDVSNFDTSNVTDMSRMFFDIQDLVSLDISNFDITKTTNVDSMFSLRDDDAYKDRLEKIYVNNDFNIGSITDSSNMFAYRYKLRGGNGSYLADPSTADKTWLRVDRPGVQGYFTRKP